MEIAYDGRQVVGMDLHRRRSVLVRMTEDGRRLGTVRITNSPAELRAQIAGAGKNPRVVLEADVRVVLGGGHAGRGGSGGAPGASAGHLRNAKLQLSAVLAPGGEVPGLYLHPDHRRRLRRAPVRSDLSV